MGNVDRDPFPELRESIDRLGAGEKALEILLGNVELRLLTIEAETLPTVKDILKSLREEVARAKHEMKSLKMMVSNVMDYQDKISGIVPLPAHTPRKKP